MYDDPGSQPVAPDTIFDIASLTKVFTATAALRLLDQGRFELTSRLCTLLPAFSDRTCRVVDLLTHTSGLDLRLSTLAPSGEAALRAAIYGAQPAHPPGSRVAYTNINALLLGDIVAAVYGAPLEQAIADLVLQPLELSDTGFRPRPERRSRIAPTEYDASWRACLVHGVVHDESAYALGGVAGHAGLFSSAGDLMRLCQAWLTAWHGQPGAIVQPQTARLACSNQTPHATLACGLGWMLDRPAFMGRAPAGSYGHTGFTGPAMVTIPQLETIVVVVSNRIYPARGPATHHEVTVALVDCALAQAVCQQSWRAGT
jgi:CubicO group peptidase (beta-lactamase class C family)